MAESGQFLSQDELLQAHRKERKDLQAKIQSLKHSVPKGHKKKKRDVAMEVAILEAELDEKHRKELEEFSTHGAQDATSLANGKAEVNQVAESLEVIATLEEGASRQVRTSKAEKRREKKRQKELLRDQEIAQQELQNEFLPRALEDRALKSILSHQGLAIYEVPSDGNCMYKAVEHQLSLAGIEKSMKALRKEAADYMLTNADDFLPFLTSKTSGDMMTPEELKDYCREVSETTTWGGQVELRALSHVCKLPIKVIQARGPCIDIGTEYNASPLLLSYHRHMYEMGEHYNSLVRKMEEKDHFDTPDV